MHKYVLLKNGDIKVLWSDNQDEETIDVYDLSELPVDWDLFIPKIESYNYSDIQEINSNVAMLKLRQYTIV